MRTKVLVSLAAAAASVLIVAGCSNDSADSPMDGQSMNSSSSAPMSSTRATASAQFNDADVMFAQMMYPHHAQAVEMAEMADGRTDNPDVLALAAEIDAAQQPEMDQMTAWLAEWGQPAPTADMGAMGGMDHSSGSGMLPAHDMAALMAASQTVPILTPWRWPAPSSPLSSRRSRPCSGCSADPARHTTMAASSPAERVRPSAFRSRQGCVSGTRSALTVPVRAATQDWNSPRSPLR